MQPCAQKSVRSSDRFIQLYHRCYLTLFAYPWRKVKVSNVTRHKDNVRTELHGKRLLLLPRLPSCSSFFLAIVPFYLPSSLCRGERRLFRWFRVFERSEILGSFWTTFTFGERECWSTIIIVFSLIGGNWRW